MRISDLIYNLAQRNPDGQVMLKINHINERKEIKRETYINFEQVDIEVMPRPGDPTKVLTTMLTVHSYCNLGEKPKVEPILRYVGTHIPIITDWVILNGVVRRVASLKIELTRERDCFECLNEKELREAEGFVEFVPGPSPFTSDNE